MKTKQTRRDKYLQKKYGISEATYKVMLALHDGKCWICDRLPKKGVLNVDHQHLSLAEKKAKVPFGRVRGLLCFFCNKYMIGRRRKEHAQLFLNAARYLSSDTDWRLYK